MLLFAAALVCVDCHRDLVERYALTPMANTSGQVRAASETPGKVGPYTITPDLRLVWAGRAGHLASSSVRAAWAEVSPLSTSRVFIRRRSATTPTATPGIWLQATSTTPRQTSAGPSRPIVFSVTPAGQCCSRAPSTGTARSWPESNASDATAHRPTTRALVNPRKLSPRLRDSICEQCHLAGEVRLAQPGKKVEDFVPGGDLAEFIEVFTSHEKASQ